MERAPDRLDESLFEFSCDDTASAWALIDAALCQDINDEDLRLAIEALEGFDNSRISYFRARMMLRAGFHERAYTTFCDGARVGFGPAQWRAGRMLLYSKHINIRDREQKGLALLREAMDSGHLFAGRSYMIALAERAVWPRSMMYRVRAAIYSVRAVWCKEVRNNYDETVM